MVRYIAFDYTFFRDTSKIQLVKILSPKSSIQILSLVYLSKLWFHVEKEYHRNV